MSRKLIWPVLLFLTSGYGLLAADVNRADVKGKFLKLDEERRTITIRIDGKDNQFPLHPNARYYDEINRQLRGGLEQARRYFKEGQDVILTVERIKERRWGTRLRAVREFKK